MNIDEIMGPTLKALYDEQELDRLIKERNLIDKKIRELRNTTIQIGRIKYEIRQIGSFRFFTLSIQRQSDRVEDRWYSILELRNSQEMLQGLKNTIDELTKMYDTLNMKEGE